MRALIETWHQECALSRYGSGRLARAARSAHPGGDTTTNPTQEPIIQDHPVPAGHGTARYAAYASADGTDP